MKFGLTDQEWKILSELAIEPLKNLGVKVWIFGSRARGDFKKFSDIDLLYSDLDDDQKSKIYSIKSSLEESSLSYKVDLVDESELAESYRNQVILDRCLI